jgi:hypothetical protein
MDTESIRSLVQTTHYTYIRPLGTGTQSSVHLLLSPHGHAVAAKIASGSSRAAALEREHALLASLHGADHDCALSSSPLATRHRPDGRPPLSGGLAVGAASVIRPEGFLPRFPSPRHAALLLPPLEPLRAFVAARAGARTAAGSSRGEGAGAGAGAELFGWAVLAQLAQALRLLHLRHPQVSVVHRDVSPDNVLVDVGPALRDGRGDARLLAIGALPRVVLADFGGARSERHDGGGGGGVGGGGWSLAAAWRAGEDVRGVARVVAFACGDGGSIGESSNRGESSGGSDAGTSTTPASSPPLDGPEAAGQLPEGWGGRVGAGLILAVESLFAGADEIAKAGQVLEHARRHWAGVISDFEKDYGGEAARIDGLLVD